MKCSFDYPGNLPHSRVPCWDPPEGTIDGKPACDQHIYNAEREHAGKLHYLSTQEEWEAARNKPLSRTVVRWESSE